MRSLDDVFTALEFSNFRKRFHLGKKEMEYLNQNGLSTILEHGQRFINERLADAEPARDGKQTPMEGHPVFIAQHATATCCRGCLHRWHHIPKKVELTSEQSAYIISVIERWLRGEMANVSVPAGRVKL